MSTHLFRIKSVGPRAFAGLVLTFVCFSLASCGDGADSKTANAKRHASKRSKKGQRPPDAFQATAGNFQKQAAAVCQGRRFRIAWVEQRDGEQPDPFVHSDGMRLVGFDSQNGFSAISPVTGNYFRPLLSPDGQDVIYTDKQAERVQGKWIFNPQIRRLSWSGQNESVLANGVAVDVTRDPATGQTWVYALEKLNPDNKASLTGNHLMRFLLKDPSQREQIWTKTALTVDNIQFSADATRFAALFPQPNAGVGFPARQEFTLLLKSCWTSLAPDNSYLFWAYVPGHRALRFFRPDEKKSWQVPVATAPGIDGAETYHPRWSNHPRFLVLTGPYPQEKGVRGTSVFYAGHSAEVFFGRFSEGMDKVEAWLRLTKNAHGDFYPDAWIDGGHEEPLTAFAQSPKS